MQRGKRQQFSSGEAVYLSYAQDPDDPAHTERVLRLANELKARDLNVVLDQFLTRAPDEGWPSWSERHIEQAGTVLAIASKAYARRFNGQESEGVGRGATFEGYIIRTRIYHDGGRNKTVIPVYLRQSDAQYVPRVLQATTYWLVDSDEAIDALARELRARRTALKLRPPAKTSGGNPRRNRRAK